MRQRQLGATSSGSAKQAVSAALSSKSESVEVEPATDYGRVFTIEITSGAMNTTSDCEIAALTAASLCRGARSVDVFIDAADECGAFGIVLDHVRRVLNATGTAVQQPPPSPTDSKLPHQQNGESGRGTAAGLSGLSQNPLTVDLSKADTEVLADLDIRALRATLRMARFFGLAELVLSTERVIGAQDRILASDLSSRGGVEALVARTRQDVNSALRMLEQSHRLRVILQEEVDSLHDFQQSKQDNSNNDKSTINVEPNDAVERMRLLEDQVVQLRLELEKEREAKRSNAQAARERFELLKQELTSVNDEVEKWMGVAERYQQKLKKKNAGEVKE